MRTGNWTPDGGQKGQSRHWQRSQTIHRLTGTSGCGSFLAPSPWVTAFPQAAQARSSSDSQAWVG